MRTLEWKSFFKPVRLVFKDVEKPVEKPSVAGKEKSGEISGAAKNEYDNQKKKFEIMLDKQSRTHKMEELQPLENIAQKYLDRFSSIEASVSGIDDADYKKALGDLNQIISQHEKETKPIFEKANIALNKKREKLIEVRTRLAGTQDKKEAEDLSNEIAQLQEAIKGAIPEWFRETAGAFRGTLSGLQQKCEGLANEAAKIGYEAREALAKKQLAPETQSTFKDKMREIQEWLAKAQEKYAAEKEKTEKKAETQYKPDYAALFGPLKTIGKSSDSFADRARKRARVVVDDASKYVGGAREAVTDVGARAIGGAVEGGKAAGGAVLDAHGWLVDRAVSGIEVSVKAHEAVTDAGARAIGGAVEGGKAALETGVGFALLTYDETKNALAKGCKFAVVGVDNMLQWTNEQWSGVIKSADFVAHYVDKGIVQVDKFIGDTSQEVWDAMVGSCDYIVKVGEEYYDIGTDFGADVIKAAVDAGAAGVELTAGLALLAYDETKDALITGAEWTRVNTDNALQWTNEQWNGVIKSADFVAHYVDKGIVNMEKFIGNTSREVWDAMVGSCDYIVKVGEEYYDIGTDFGADVIKAAVDAGAAGVELTAGLALLAYDEVKRMLGDGMAWGDEQMETAKKFSGEQWDKLARSGEFAYMYCRDGIVDMGKAVATMGIDACNTMVDGASHLIEYGGNVINIATREGKEILRALKDTAAEEVEIGFGLGLLAYDDVKDSLAKGSKWSVTQIDNALQWTNEQWGRVIKSAEFAAHYVDKNGFVKVEKCIEDFGKDAYDTMLKITSLPLVEKAGKLMYKARERGKEALGT